MSIAIREKVQVGPDRSVHLSSRLLEPGSKAEVIVLVDAKSITGKPYSAFDAMRANPIDAPEDFSENFENEQRL
ncbi:MAG: hypothetical protein ACKVQK_21675 [Burkholderiales bacterium]